MIQLKCDHVLLILSFGIPVNTTSNNTVRFGIFSTTTQHSTSPICQIVKRVVLVIRHGSDTCDWNALSLITRRIVLTAYHLLYRSQVVEGTDCIVETYSRNKASAGSSAHSSSIDRRDKPHPGHHDVITDVSMYHTTDPFIVSASACGVVKVWK